MSRIGKLPIQIPSGVTITVDEDAVKVAGPKGQLQQALLSNVTVAIEDGTLTVTRQDDSKVSKSQHGLMRALINNMVTGVTNGFEKKLEINGVGFRVSGGGQQIDMTLGFSHPVIYKAVDGVALTVEKNQITVSGISKQQVGQIAAEIRALKKPEPYKGKGIKYVDEVVARKAGKAGK
jgi:large subunit ribosomal protein L6